MTLRSHLGWAACVFAWFWTGRHLSTEWKVNEQYYYAWGVWPLALWMVSRRPLAAARGRPELAALLAIPAAAAFCLGELLRWQDPLWRLTGGLLFAGAALFTAACLLADGGVPALRGQLFPLCFTATALPWPVPAELFVTRHLLYFVTTAVTASANLCGIAAWQRGNVIEVSTGSVGIEDACSGIESLQAALMAALFLGEFFRLGARRRVILVGAGALSAVLANTLRIFVIVLFAARKGQERAQEWHDSLGIGAAALTFGLLYLAGWILKSEVPPMVRAPAPAHRATARPSWLVVSAGGLILVAPGLAWLWFSFGAGGPATVSAAPLWRTLFSRLPPDWRVEPFPPRSREEALLRYTEREGWRITRAGELKGWLVHFWWDPGHSLPGQAFMHTPESCLPWMGWKPAGPPEQIVLRAKGVAWPALGARFTLDGAELCAIQILVTGGRVEPPESDLARLGSRHLRFMQLWRAPRRQVDEELLLYTPTGADPLAPWAEAEKLLAIALGDAGAERSP